MSSLQSRAQFEATAATAGAYFPYVLFVLFIVSRHWGGSAWSLPAGFVLLVVPILDLVVGESNVNLESKDFRPIQRSLLILAPFGFVVGNSIAVFIAAMQFGNMNRIEQVSSIFSVGVIGSIGITAAHELIHKWNRLSKVFGRMGLLNVCYLHFEINHVEGHHVNYGTSKDLSTASRGESLYAFVLRTVPGCLKLSWDLELRRLKHLARPIFSRQNRMLQFGTLQCLFIGGLVVLGGLKSLLFYFAQAAVAVFMLESVAFIKHYGLLRGPRDSPNSLPHSWDNYFRISNYLEFQLQRHADHHASPRKPHYQLRAASSAARLPAGYPVMIALSMIPPIWRRIMHPRLETQSRTARSH